MNTPKLHLGFCRKIIALCVLAAFGPASAAEGDEVAQLTQPESSVSVGLGAVSGDSKDRAIFGQYTGMRKNSGYGLFDIDLVKRENVTGTWTTFTGRNLGLDNRELGFSQQKQGDWKYYVEYGELVRNYSNTINTGVTGIGTANLTVTALGTPGGGAAALAAAQGTGSNIDLKTTRTSLGFGLDKWLTPILQLEASFKNEKKDGARMWGKGITCSATSGYGCTASYGALLMLPEPISSSTKQFEAKLNYAGEKLTLSGGYYGSFYINDFGSLNVSVPGNLWNPDGSLHNLSAAGNNIRNLLQLPMALPPDNQAHQLSLTGTYAFTPTTRGTFRFARTRATQKESFDSMGLTGSPRGALDAVVDTTLAQFGLTARPMPKLSLLANLRYEQKSDKTPIDWYRTANTNSPGSHTKISGKLEASYQLPDRYRATVGIDYDMRDLGRPTGTNDTSGQATALRAKNDEIGYRAELRRSMSETFSGAVGIGHSRRNGSRWMQAFNGPAPTVPEGTLQGTGFGLFPLLWMDNTRDKLKLSANWDPTERLSLQFMTEASADHYYAPTMRGARDGATRVIGLDSMYTVTEKWKLTGWFSRSDTIMDINGGSGAYSEGMRQLNHSLGLGFRGAPTGKIDIGGDVVFSYETNRYGQGVIGNSTQPNALPAVAYRQTSLKLFGKYALEKNADIRLDLVHQRYFTNEWYWSNNGVPFFYSDGTTLIQQPTQNVTFIGATYIYKWQ